MSEPVTEPAAPPAPAPDFRRSFTIQTFFPESLGIAELSSYNPGKKDDAIPYLKAVGSPANTLRNCVGDVIEVQHVVARNIEMLDPATGELTAAVRMVLVAPDGRMWSTTSEPVQKMIFAAYRTAFGRPPWKPALKWLVTEHDGRGDHVFLNVELVTDDRPASPPKQPKD